MRNSKFKMVEILIVFIVLAISGTMFADELPKGEVQIWTSVEGNIKYYVKAGDLVKKGTPLFYIENSDNNAALFWKTEHKIDYYKKLYSRRVKLAVSHAVSQEEADNALENLIDAEDELTALISKAEQGFYVAPFDCEITKLLYLQGSGIGDGNPAINIKCTDKNYKFEPQEPNKKLIEILNQRDKLMKERAEELKINNLDL